VFGEGSNKVAAIRKLSLFAGILVCLGIAGAGEGQPAGLESRKAQLEVQKLELEVASLAKKKSEVPDWLTGFLGLLVGAGGVGATVLVARLAKISALDQEVHKKRIESYGALVETTEPFALYFTPAKPIDPEACRQIGEAMRAWYFKGGGLLMSTEARDAYFALARALTRAWFAQTLRVPVFPDNALEISVVTVDEYRSELSGVNLDDVEKWTFGASELESGNPAYRFKDFVFLQTCTSRLRTELSADLHSRRRPS